MPRTQAQSSLDSYYFSFEPTGNLDIDLILHAAAKAGKTFHRTEQWVDPPEFKGLLEGDSPQEWIQNAAKAAAKNASSK